MSKDKDEGFREEYEKESSTTTDHQPLKESDTISFDIDENKYGINKPKRIFIRAIISHDKDSK